MGSSTVLAQVTDPKDALQAVGVAVQPIPELKLLPQQRMLDALSDATSPVLVRGAASGWSVLTRWTPDNLACEFGEIEVTPLVNLPADGVLFPQDQESYAETMTLAAFIRRMKTARIAAPCYLAYQRISQLLDAVDDLDFAQLIGARAGQSSDTRLWIGSAGTRSLLHSDLKDNVFCQISGQKIVTLLPWSQSRCAYPFPDNLVNSQLDLARPDLRRFPRLADATFLSSRVGPGDVVYIPKGCWHDMRACTPSVSVNHWFGPSQTFSTYVRLLARLGPRYWYATLRDFLLHGALRRREPIRFFFSPASTGKRLFSALRTGSFSADNDPTGEESRTTMPAAITPEPR